MSQNQGMQVQLPERVTLNLSAQEVVTILGALQDSGPYKTINPVVRTVEQQVLSQQLTPQYQGPPPAAPETIAPPPADVPQETPSAPNPA